jgi:demethylsterigmatocystin 6-O-methyltransferase
MEAVLAQAKGLVNTVDDSKRTKIIDTLRDLQYSLESPYDTWQRFSGLVSTLIGAYTERTW